MKKFAGRKNRKCITEEDLAQREQKEVSRFLLPDAPERKQKRNVSPARLPCPLLPNTPPVPPPYKPQPWETRRPNPTATQSSKTTPPARESGYINLVGPSRFISPDSPEPGPSGINASMDEELINQTTSQEDIGQELSPLRKRWKVRFAPSAGIQTSEPEEEIGEEKFIKVENTIQSLEEISEANNIKDETEYIGLTPTSSTTISTHEQSLCCCDTNAQEPASSSFSQDVSIFEDDEARIVEWERSNAMEDAGSDIDDIDQDVNDSDIVNILSRQANTACLADLPPDAMELLRENDSIDDSALRALSISEYDRDILHFDWSSDANVFTGQREIFTGPSGPTFNTDGMSPFELFKMIWDEDIINLIVRETNRYAHQLQSTNAEIRMLKSWIDVTANDIWLFFAVIMLQSICPIPVEREYWYPCLHYLKMGDFNRIMPHKRFTLIKKCLHFVDNITLSGVTGENTKLRKIAPIIRHLNNKFSTLYLPEQNIAIDESLLLWKGRLSFAQLIATKAARVGIKSYELCESRTGYLWKMKVYTGRGDNTKNNEQRDDEPQKGTSQIVFELVRPLLNKGHTLVMDNFYNSPLLSRTLKLKRTDTIGTLRVNREFVPNSVRNKTKSNTRIGEVVISQTNDLSVLVWHDSNMVSMISTYHKPGVSGKEKHGYYKYKPQVILDYNISMGGVDKKDQMLQAFPVERSRNLIWYKKLFRRLLNVSIYNAFVMYNHNKNQAQRQFRVALVDEIISKIKPQDPKISQPKMDHFPVKAESSKARCKLCAKRKIEARTSWKCDTCGINLCIVNCFKEYHVSLSE